MRYEKSGTKYFLQWLFYLALFMNNLHLLYPCFYLPGGSKKHGVELVDNLSFFSESIQTWGIDKRNSISRICPAASYILPFLKTIYGVCPAISCILRCLCCPIYLFVLFIYRQYQDIKLGDKVSWVEYVLQFPFALFMDNLSLFYYYVLFIYRQNPDMKLGDEVSWVEYVLQYPFCAVYGQFILVLLLCSFYLPTASRHEARRRETMSRMCPAY